MHKFCEPKEMSDDDLLTSLEVLAVSEKRLGASIVVHLAMVETRQLHLALGHSSLYAYAIKQLGFSEDVAYKRIKAARAVRSCPEIVGHLESGQLSLSSVLVLAPHLDQTASAELVSGACGKSRREVERLVAELFPETNRPRGGTRSEMAGAAAL